MWHSKSCKLSCIKPNEEYDEFSQTDEIICNQDDLKRESACRDNGQIMLWLLIVLMLVAAIMRLLQRREERRQRTQVENSGKTKKQ